MRLGVDAYSRPEQPLLSMAIASDCIAYDAAVAQVGSYTAFHRQRHILEIVCRRDPDESSTNINLCTK